MAKTGSIVITQGTKDTANKRTYITVAGKITTTGESYRGDHRTGAYTIKQGNTVLKSDTFTHGAPAKSTTTLFTVGLWVYHDSSGDSGIISASYDYDSGWCTGNASTTLTRFCTVSYDANGGSGAPGSQTYVYGGSKIKLSTTVPKRTGYNFLGWSTSKTATTASYAPGTEWNSYNPNNYTLYAVWIKVHSITLDGNGGLVNGKTVVTQTVANQTNVNTLPEAAKVHYKFLGWNTEADGSGEYLTSIVATSDLTLYAIYEAESNHYVRVDGSYQRGVMYQKANGKYCRAVKISKK